ncbi:hypothetical protein [uncultured Christiangramia sp.]|uniref:hypothetical protein n=1 Tax=Christiangramia sp. 3-2217-3z TaxID=3417564 RepID=UPI002617C088|nr:hypothetical protein [uncultured Christiangramia sp.]
MKSLKPLLFILVLTFSISINAQIKDSVSSVSDSSSDSSTSSPTYFANNQDLYKSNYTLVLYNSTTDLYDTYSATSDVYYYSGSTKFYKPKTNFLTTLFLGNDSFGESNTVLEHRSILLADDVSYRIRDSFNPHGASNMSEALIGGVFGLLLN